MSPLPRPPRLNRVFARRSREWMNVSVWILFVIRLPTSVCRFRPDPRNVRMAVWSAEVVHVKGRTFAPEALESREPAENKEPANFKGCRCHPKLKQSSPKVISKRE